MRSSSSKTRQTRILLVEDNDHARIMISEVLRAAGGFAVHPARDAYDAMAKLALVEPDLIICDWTMAGMDGLELTAWIRRGAVEPDAAIPDPLVPIIMLTGRRTRSAVDAARDGGVDEFVVKPFAPAILLARIDQVRENRRPFIAGEAYIGPDRRRRDPRQYGGRLRRAADAEVVVVDDRRARFRDRLDAEIAALRTLIHAEGGASRDCLKLALTRMTQASVDAETLKLKLIHQASDSLTHYIALVGEAADTEVVSAHLESMSQLLAIDDSRHAEGRIVVSHLERLVMRKTRDRAAA